MSIEDEERQFLGQLLDAARDQAPPPALGDRVLDHVAYRRRLEQASPSSGRSARRVIAASVVVALAAAFVLLARGASQSGPLIAPEHAPAPGGLAPQPAAGPVSSSRAPVPVIDPCRVGTVAAGNAPLIDDFEDGDDAVLPLDGRAGFWRWAREIDAPGTAPALIPLPRPDATHGNRLALHVKGGQLVDWGATVEFNFRPACYDASKYSGLTFQARGPGRIYLAPREVSVIPIAEGGTCDHDCHNPHVAKFDLDAAWRVYEVHWADVRQRGMGKPPLDPKRLNSIAFLIRPEDTPYDVWLDDVKFEQ